MTDYYRILEVSPSASTSEIRQAYRRLALKWHPDKNPTNQVEATSQFKKVSNAYEILGDPARRGQYDTERANPNYSFENSKGGGTSGRENFTFTSSYCFQSPEDIFKSFFKDIQLFFNFDNLRPIYGNSSPGSFSSSFQLPGGSGGGGGPSYFSTSIATRTIDGRTITTKTTVTNGEEVKEIYENNRLTSRIRQKPLN